MSSRGLTEGQVSAACKDGHPMTQVLFKYHFTKQGYTAVILAAMQENQFEEKFMTGRSV